MVLKGRHKTKILPEVCFVILRGQDSHRLVHIGKGL